MKNIIFFFGSFDPLHKGHISIIENAIKSVNADCLYIGVNKSSTKGKLTPLRHRIAMLKSYAKNREKIEVVNFAFDYKNIEQTYTNIFNLMEDDAKHYILIGQDQLSSLKNWYKYDLLVKNFSFIIAKRGNIEIDNTYLDNNQYIFIDHNYKQISSTLIKNGKYEYTDELIKNYILNHNLYLKLQIKAFLSESRYTHTLSVAKTALLINKKARLGLNQYKVEKAALLHDIAKELSKEDSYNILKKEYPQYIDEDKKIIHQYLGEYIAKEKFYVQDNDILNAIKFHTTGKINMSLLEKLIYVSDKIEPTRQYDTITFLKECQNDFDKGFRLVLKNSKEYLESKNITNKNKDTIDCFKYYL